MIFKALTVGFIATNCYIVGSEKTRRGLIIDPGSNAQTILSAVNSLKMTVEMIVVTHSHMDHFGAVAELKDATGAKFAVGGNANAKPGDFTRMASKMSIGSNSMPEPDIILKDGDVIDIDDLHFEILFTPGHSPDEISLYGHGVLFSGDTLFCSGIGRTDFPGCSFQQLSNSIRNKLYKLPDNTMVFPGHGPETTIGDEKRGNPFIR